MGKNVKMGPRANDKFEKRDLKWTKGLKCRPLSPSPSLTGDVCVQLMLEQTSFV